MNYRGKFVPHSNNLSPYFKSRKFGMVWRIGLYYFVCEWLSVTTCFSDKRTHTCIHSTRKRKYAVARRVKVFRTRCFPFLRHTVQVEFRTRVNKWILPPFIFVFQRRTGTCSFSFQINYFWFILRLSQNISTYYRVVKCIFIINSLW